jgi:hypothetical protein
MRLKCEGASGMGILGKIKRESGHVDEAKMGIWEFGIGRRWTLGGGRKPN